MPKFNKNMIKGIEQTGEVRVGAGLLNDASKAGIKMKIEHVPRNLIDKNRNNKYSINGIESLAWSIREMGLLQPLHLSKKDNGRYEILGGERRITAIDRLIADPEAEEWTEESLIPAVVKGAEQIMLPLSGELKEKLSIVTTNKEARKYTDGDRLQEIRDWKEIISALRDAGVKSLPGVDGEGNETEIRIQGEKTRDILAQTTGLSRGTVNSYEKVENQGSTDLKEALLNNDISLRAASHLIENTGTEEEQKEVLDSLKGKGKEATPGNIDEELEQKGRKRKKGMTEPGEQEEGSRISAASFRKDMAPILSRLKKKDAILDESGLEMYHSSIRTLEKILGIGEKTE